MNEDFLKDIMPAEPEAERIVSEDEKARCWYWFYQSSFS